MLNSSQTSQIKNNYFNMKCKITTYYASHNLSKTPSKILLLNPAFIDKENLYDFLINTLDDEPTLLNTDKTIKIPLILHLENISVYGIGFSIILMHKTI